MLPALSEAWQALVPKQKCKTVIHTGGGGQQILPFNSPTTCSTHAPTNVCLVLFAFLINFILLAFAYNVR